jgi:hypothetical protein
MATRKIIDIEQNGEKVWPKGHANATFMSDGSTVEDVINSIKTDIGGGTGSETNHIQSDWAQGDVANDSYIKNRTHYTSVMESIGEFTTVSKEVGDVLYEGLSLGGFYTIINLSNTANRTMFQFVTGRKINIPFNGPTVEAVCSEGGSLVLASPTYGIVEPFSVRYTEVKQIDSVYIPETIARKEEANNVYVTDFTVYDLEYMHDNPEGAMQFDIRSLYAAFVSHKVVLVPYGDGSAGYGVATGYQDDFLYVSIMLQDGRCISLEIPYIDNNSIYPENIYIGTLAYEGSLKTINGQSIVGSGNIEINGGGGGSSSNGKNLVSSIDLIFSEDEPLLPDTTYYCNDVAAIDISAVTPPSGDYAEYTLLFKTDEDVYITCPDNWLWANGQVPSVEGETVYELSVVATKFGSDYIYKAVLTPFKSV